jgi:hypothetical protein
MYFWQPQPHPGSPSHASVDSDDAQDDNTDGIFEERFSYYKPFFLLMRSRCVQRRIRAPFLRLLIRTRSVPAP